MSFDKSKFIVQFKTETKEHIQNINQWLLKFEKKPHEKSILESLMKEAHTIKGSAAMMEYKKITDIAHKMEDGLEKMLKQNIKMSKNHFDVLFECLDIIESLLTDKTTEQVNDADSDESYVAELSNKLDKVFSLKKTAKPDVQSPKDRKAREGRMESIPSNLTATAASKESVRVDTDKLNKLMNLSGELLISKTRLNELVENLIENPELQNGINESINALMKELKSVDENINFSASNLQAEVINIRMVPISHLFTTFPRAVRNLAHEKGKDIELVIRGEDTQLDKVIIDEMKEPIMHLLRNAVDHGIEEPAVRREKNKPKTAKITLNAYQKGSHVVIEVSDDGRGIDVNKVKEEAVNKGLIQRTKALAMSDKQIMELIFTPGFSTNKFVNEISGRGIGLEVVRERTVNLKGMIEVASRQDAGTTFIIKLPLTLAITENLLVTAGNNVFAIPVDAISETIRIDPKEIKNVQTKEAITVRGEIIPLVKLNEILGISTKGIIEKRFLSVVIVQSAQKKIGLLIDQLLGRREIVSKPLGYPLKKIENIAGGTILGDGRVILILDIPSIIDSAEGVVPKQTTVKSIHHRIKEKKVLLAEDTLSTAVLEKNILESAGFSVILARDGAEALKRASQEKFDLVITDVLMPRMDGFSLTAKLKQDKAYKDIPVIIVTSRASDEDKKHGLEAGAEAYIPKGEFTSETLMDTIEKLVG